MKQIYWYYLDTILENVYAECGNDDIEMARKDGCVINEDCGILVSTKEKIGLIKGRNEIEYLEDNIDSYMGYQLKTMFDEKYDHSRINITRDNILAELDNDCIEDYLNEKDIEDVLNEKIDYSKYIDKLCKRVAINLFQLRLDEFRRNFKFFCESNDDCMIDTD